jgi:hypothetical protein
MPTRNSCAKAANERGTDDLTHILQQPERWYTGASRPAHWLASAFRGFPLSLQANDEIASFLNLLLFIVTFQFYSTTSTVQVRKGKHLPDAFSIQNGLNQGDALSPLLFNFTLEYAIRKVRE